MPLLAALAGQPHGRLAAVEVVDGETDGLGDAGPGAVQQLQQRAVAQPAGPSTAPAASISATTDSTGTALGSRRAGVGGRTSCATSSGTRPSSRANRCSPRTATTARAADVADSGGWSSSPCRSAVRNPATSDSATSRMPRTPAAARYSVYRRRSRR